MIERIVIEKDDIYIMGYQKVIKVSIEEVHIKMNKYVLKIFGDHLICTYFAKGEINIHGTILMVKKDDRL